MHEHDEAFRTRIQGEERFAGLKWVSEDDLLADDSLDMIVVECNSGRPCPGVTKLSMPAVTCISRSSPLGPGAVQEGWSRKAKAKKRILQLGYKYRFHECIGAALDATRNGWLGEVYLMRATTNSNRPPEERKLEARYPAARS